MSKSIITRLSLLLMALITISILSTPVTASGSEPDGQGPFVDTDGSQFEDPIAAIWADDVTAGCAAWRFCPDDPVTRGEMAAFLARALELADTGDADFVDTEDHTFSDDIDAIAAADITHGCTDERFCPEDAVTRAQMASFLARALDLAPAPPSSFEDIADPEHRPDIDSLAAAGITAGCSPTQFCPDRRVTRKEMAALLTRALDLPVPEDLPQIPDEVIEDYRDEADEEEESGSGGWRDLVEQYFPASDVDYALAVIECESGGDPNAYNPSSGASGLFQHLPQYWDERASAAGFAGASIFDPEVNIAASAWLVYDAADGGWHHWTCA